MLDSWLSPGLHLWGCTTPGCHSPPAMGRLRDRRARRHRGGDRTSHTRGRRLVRLGFGRCRRCLFDLLDLLLRQP